MNQLVKTTLQTGLSLDKQPKLPSSLLSPVTFQNVVFGLKWGSFWGGIPYEYDQSQNRLKVTKKAVRQWKIITILQLIILSYFVSVVVYLTLPRLPFGNNNNVMGYIKKNYLTTLVAKTSLFDNAFAFIVAMLQCSMLIGNISIGAVHQAEYCSLVNRQLQFLIYLKEKYTNKFGGKWRNGCEELMIAMRIMATTFPLLAMLHFFQHPENMIYMTARIPRVEPFYTVACLCYAFLLITLQVAGLGNVLGIVSPMLAFFFCYINLIHEIRAGKKVYRTKPTFRYPSALQNLIRALQLISNHVNIISGQVLMFEQSLITCTGTVCLFCVIHFWSGLTFSGRAILVYTALTTLGIWTMILTVAAHVYTTTEKSLNTWRNFAGWTPGEKKEMKKFRRSIRPIQMEFGGFYYIRPKKIMGFWNTFVWLTARSLLTFPVHH